MDATAFYDFSQATCLKTIFFSPVKQQSAHFSKPHLQISAPSVRCGLQSKTDNMNQETTN